MRVVVVGAGLGGLSAACHLAGNALVTRRDREPGAERRADRSARHGAAAGTGRLLRKLLAFGEVGFVTLRMLRGLRLRWR